MCSCRNCPNDQLYDPDVVKEHLRCDRFMLGNTNWVFHGESISSEDDDDDGVDDDDIGEFPVDMSPSRAKASMSNDMRGLIHAAFTQTCEDPVDNELHSESSTNSSNSDQMRYLDLFEDNEEELYPGCKKFSKLSYAFTSTQMHEWMVSYVSFLVT